MAYKDEIIKIFNKSLQDELSSQVIYIKMAENAVGISLDTLREELIQHADEEYSHFKKLVEYAATHSFLDKLNFSISTDIIGKLLKTQNEIIEITQKLELDAIETYKKATKLADDNNDYEAMDFFISLMKDEMSHFDDLAKFDGKKRKLSESLKEKFSIFDSLLKENGSDKLKESIISNKKELVVGMLLERALTTKERKEIKSEDYGLPDLKKYPLIDEKHIKLAIKFFKFCPENRKAELAEAIMKKAKEKNIELEQNSIIFKYVTKK